MTVARILDRMQNGRRLSSGGPHLQILPSLTTTSALPEMSLQTYRLGFGQLRAEQALQVAGRGALRLARCRLHCGYPVRETSASIQRKPGIGKSPLPIDALRLAQGNRYPSRQQSFPERLQVGTLGRQYVEFPEFLHIDHGAKQFGYVAWNAAEQASANDSCRR